MFEIRKQVNVKGFSFPEFVDFLFDREIPPEFDRSGKRSEKWYYSVDVEYEPIELVDWYTKLFSEPAFLLERFSKEKLEQGFWAIMGGPLDCSVDEAIWESTVGFARRAECVRSMFHLYEKLFAIDPLETSSHMWWDSLTYGWHCGNRYRKNGGEDLLMQDVMFETLEKILALSETSCQVAALHGLGHLHHPNTAELISNYLKRKPHKDMELREYANAAAKFDVL